MILIDTSVLVPVLRDTSNVKRRALAKVLGGKDFAITRFTQIELLQGAIGDAQWSILDEYLADQDYAEASPETWVGGARIFYELRRRGKTIRNVIDCIIGQICIERKLTLLHNDRDFEAIATIRQLRNRRVAL